MMKNIKITVLAALVAIFAVNCSVDSVTTPGPASTGEGTAAAPVALTLGTAHAGNVDGSGDSYYTLTVPAGTSVTCSVTAISNDVNIYVYGTSNFLVLITSGNNGGTTSEMVTWIPSTAPTPPIVTAYIKVSAFTSINSTYTITCN